MVTYEQLAPHLTLLSAAEQLSVASLTNFGPLGCRDPSERGKVWPCNSGQVHDCAHSNELHSPRYKDLDTWGIEFAQSTI
jgi:hypothetical protein